jgi:hypothetical protein
MKKRRFKLILRGMALGMDPLIAFRPRSFAVRYRGIDASLRSDWYAVGGDMRASLEKFEREHVGGVAASHA